MSNQTNGSHFSDDTPWTVYLSGEIHTDWRDQIEAGATEAGLPIEFVGPVTDHASSDDCGVDILGDEP
ncbi:MAG: YtoQ family protein, partial [Rhodospirillales bacterium]